MTGPSRTDGIVLRPVREADVEQLFQHQADPEAVRMGGYQPRGREEHRAHWRTLLADPSLNHRTVLVGDTVAGHVSAWTEDGMRQVGYVIGREFWGRGVATAALRAFLAVEPARPLWAYVAAGNVGSLRVLAKSGFRRVEELAPDGHGVVYVVLACPPDAAPVAAAAARGT